MTKALIKKQLMEAFSWLYKDRKSGNIRSKSSMIGFGILYLALFVMLGSFFYTMAEALCEPLFAIGFGWLYFALMGLLAVALGVFGSVFSTYTTLYLAKDNDLLLSLPLPPSKILMVRLAGVYLMGLMYELIVMIPAVLVFFLQAPITPLGAVFALLSPLVLSLLILTLSCLLGYVVALVSSRMKHKNLITVALSLGFIAAYYYVVGQAYQVLENILANPQQVADSVRSVLYPFYCMGLATEGDWLSMLIFTAIMVALFAMVFLVLSHNFLKLATTNRGTAKAKYKEKAAIQGSVNSALLKKEFRRFLNSPTYMLNCGLGTIFMLIAAVALLIKGSTVRELMYTVFAENPEIISLLAAAAVCTVSSMNDMSAPSVSLEGKTIWLLHALPVPAFQALKAKWRLHLALTLPSAMILTLAAEIVLKLELGISILLLVLVMAFVLFMALAGLFLNLKLPNLTWTNETVPVKQGMSVMLALFGGWAVVIVLSFAYYAARNLITPTVFLALSAGLLLILSALIYHFMKTKGAKILETL